MEKEPWSSASGISRSASWSRITQSRHDCGAEPLHPQAVSRAFALAVAAARMPAIRVHDRRQLPATPALQTGIHPKVVSERLGHATIAITLDTHTHAIPAMQESAAALIAGSVSAEKQPTTP